MRRSDFFKHGFLAGLGVGLVPALPACTTPVSVKNPGNAKNIIFLVSDGMSVGTLTMADQLCYMRDGRGSNWMNLYREGVATRGLMDMSSLNSIITDSAAASSSWGSGYRVNNGAVNMGPNGESYTPILQKFKDAGKAVGCVTSVPITHATPAGFSVSTEARGDQAKIAELYLAKKYDVMFGAGSEYFESTRRADQRDMFSEFVASGYDVVRDKTALQGLTASSKPVLGVFNVESLPYMIDHQNTPEQLASIPTLAEMTDNALRLLSAHENGFFVQIEGGKVDWAAHSNDAAGILYDQLAFDDALAVALAFAEGRDDTLIVITSDHGNANPGLLYGREANQKFESLLNVKHSNDWILSDLNENSTVTQIRERVEFATGHGISTDEAQAVKSALTGEYRTLYEPMQDAPEVLGAIMTNYTSVAFVGDNHTSDYTELAMVGAGSENMPAFIKNTDLHHFLLETAGVTVSAS
jgi:alkaline phosphatase